MCCSHCPSLKLLLWKQLWDNEKLLKDSLSYGMSFPLTLARFSLPNVEGMSRISKLCLGAKPQVWTKTLQFFTTPVKPLRDWCSGAGSDASKGRRYPSHGGRTFVYLTSFLGTAPLLAEQSTLWHTRSGQDFLFPCPHHNAGYGKRKTGKGKIHRTPIPCATPIVFQPSSHYLSLLQPLLQAAMCWHTYWELHSSLVCNKSFQNYATCKLATCSFCSEKQVVTACWKVPRPGWVWLTHCSGLLTLPSPNLAL